MISVACRFCDVTFEYKRRGGGVRAYCSDECRAAKYRADHYPGGVRPDEVDESCARCGSSFSRKIGRGQVQKYCSADCRIEANRPAPRPRKPKKPKPSATLCTCRNCGIQWTREPIRGPLPKWCSDCTGMTERICPHCKLVKPIGTGSKNCRDCWLVIQPPRSKELEVWVRPSRRIDHVRTASRLSSGRCRVCSAWFISFHQDVTCSVECKSIRDRDRVIESSHRRRAVKRAAFRAPVSRRKVFAADGYRCHLCNKMTDRTKTVPHPKAPTIDHVVPLADGGTHEPLNCRTAHFMCNATKGDRGGGEQLLLIA